ncbi:MAG: LAGLIDADG family homing endonuclease [Patescibacteria group bacterium]
MLNAEYIIGLVDGEGSFYVRLNEDPKRRNKIEFKFSLKLRHQDKEILEQLQSFFDCGKIYLQKDNRPNHTDCYRFEVNNKKDIFNKIMPFFEKNSPKIQSRKRDFELFKQIFYLSLKDNLDLKQIQFLKQQMHWGLAVYGKSVRTVGNQ